MIHVGFGGLRRLELILGSFFLIFGGVWLGLVGFLKISVSFGGFCLDGWWFWGDVVWWLVVLGWLSGLLWRW